MNSVNVPDDPRDVDMWQRASEGESVRSIARSWGVSKSLVQKVLTRMRAEAVGQPRLPVQVDLLDDGYEGPPVGALTPQLVDEFGLGELEEVFVDEMGHQFDRLQLYRAFRGGERFRAAVAASESAGTAPVRKADGSGWA